MNARAVRLPRSRDLTAPVAFGITELEHALRAGGWTAIETAAHELRLARDTGIESGGFVITQPAGATEIRAADDAGHLYGCLELAERLESGDDLTAVTRDVRPYVPIRGVYTFLHHPDTERWLHDAGHWRRYADALARARFNRFNLVFGHQTAHLVPVYAFLFDELATEFPDVVTPGVTRVDRARNLQALEDASAAMADRGIAFFAGIWQSRPWTTAGGALQGQAAEVQGLDDSDRLAAYTRRGLGLLLDRLPHLRGLQLRVNIESGVADQRFFVRAMAPVVKERVAAGRPLTVELRAWRLNPETIDAFRDTGADLLLSAKYFAEHQGLPSQPAAMRDGYSYDSMLRRSRREPLLWQLWSMGSHRLFRWGDPDHARRFARSTRFGGGAGFEITPPGSQRGFSQWGLIEQAADVRTDLEGEPDFDRYWFFLTAFGRAGFDPTTGDEVFTRALERRAGAGGAALLTAYRRASGVISYLITQRMDDPNMYVWPELDAGGPIDHHTLAPPGDPTLFATAREHAADRVAGRSSAKRSPFDAAADLDRMAGSIEESLAGITDDGSAERRGLLADFRALGALARYHAAKSRAAGGLALFYASGERAFLDDAESAARRGIALWDELCARTAMFAPRLHLGPSGGHWRDNRPRVAYDLARIGRVREHFEHWGLFARGLDLGVPLRDRRDRPPGAAMQTGLEPEPRFLAVTPRTMHAPGRSHGWLRADGLRAVAPGAIPADLLWGVDYLQAGAAGAPDGMAAMPLEGLRERHIVAGEPRVLRIDAPAGEHEVTVVRPFVTGEPPQTVRLTSTAGHLDLRIEGAVAAVTVRPLAPLIAHLPPFAHRAEADLVLTATVTAPDPIVSVTLRHTRNVPVTADGAAFRAVIPAPELRGDSADYELTATDAAGRVTRLSARTPLVHAFRAPAVRSAEGPASWHGQPVLRFVITIAEPACAREVRLHWREADQNRPWRTAVERLVRDTCALTVDATELDPDYDLLWYVELLDALGGGSFHPDPFTDARYVVVSARA